MGIIKECLFLSSIKMLSGDVLREKKTWLKTPSSLPADHSEAVPLLQCVCRYIYIAFSYHYLFLIQNENTPI